MSSIAIKSDSKLSKSHLSKKSRSRHYPDPGTNSQDHKPLKKRRPIRKSIFKQNQGTLQGKRSNIKYDSTIPFPPSAVSSSNLDSGDNSVTSVVDLTQFEEPDNDIAMNNNGNDLPQEDEILSPAQLKIILDLLGMDDSVDTDTDIAINNNGNDLPQQAILTPDQLQKILDSWIVDDSVDTNTDIAINNNDNDPNCSKSVKKDNESNELSLPSLSNDDIHQIVDKAMAPNNTPHYRQILPSPDYPSNYNDNRSQSPSPQLPSITTTSNYNNNESASLRHPLRSPQYEPTSPQYD